MAYVPPPTKEEIEAFADLVGIKLRSMKPKTPYPGGLRKRWKDEDNDIWEWDYQHGEFERYNKTGKTHKGAYSLDGKQSKPPDTTRNVEA